MFSSRTVFFPTTDPGIQLDSFPYRSLKAITYLTKETSSFITSILNDTSVTPFELFYSTPNGNKSIIGQLMKYLDGSMYMIFGPTVELNYFLSTLYSHYHLFICSAISILTRCSCD
uniref:Uncharacterized protein n=1 Tax=Heterorhabditis bacteriophora TaxID=37862 RepID=A0A1I7WQ71_HETBA